MASLFIDSTYDITLGILDDDLGWIKFQRFFGQKASSVLQKETHELLTASSLSMDNIERVISIAGPGFYTGLRLSEGLADVMSFFDKRTYSFLSYHIPFYTGVHKGVWMTKAYRGEYFFHHWEGSSFENVLITAKELESYMLAVDKSTFYIHSDSAIDDLSRSFLSAGYLTTSELLQRQPQHIFNRVLATDTKVESFYFRAPEDEFKVSL